MSLENKFYTRVATGCLTISGPILFLHTLYGLFAMLGIGFDSIYSVIGVLCLTMPFPIYLLGMKSLRIATVGLWVFFLAQWLFRWSVDGQPMIGILFTSPYAASLLGAIILVHIAYWMLSQTAGKKKPVKIGDAF